MRTATPVTVARAAAEPLGPLQNTFVVSARSVANPDLLVPSILQEYALGNAVRVAFELPIGDLSNRPTSAQLAVRTVTPSGDTVRYLLVPPQTGAILWPQYAGQTLYPGAVVEVWSVVGQATAVLPQITLTIGTLTYPGEYLWFQNTFPQNSSTIV